LEWCWQNKRDYNLECEITRYPFLYGGAINHWVDANMCYPLCFNGNAFDNVPTGVIGCRTFGNGRMEVQDSVAGHATLKISGVGFLNSLIIGFDKEPELEDMLDSREMSKLSLELTEVLADRTVSVVVEEEILY
ncbi:unnamed protein product, partial [marine sediment metagenome]